MNATDSKNKELLTKVTNSKAAEGMINIFSGMASMFDFKTQAERKQAIRKIEEEAYAMREKLKAVADSQIDEINNKAAVERKVINDRAAVERKIVRSKLDEDIKKINEEEAAVIKKINDKIIDEKMKVATGVLGVLGSTGVFDAVNPFGQGSKGK